VTLLLDTHILMWAVADPGRLSHAARAAIENPETALTVSAVSFWEMSIKHASGKWPEATAILNRYPEVVERLNAAELRVTAAHGIMAGRLAWGHRDPFDRMLAAQAVIGGMEMISADRAFDGFGAVRRVW
jgi:PIN domain nuclease of toxin-antitoxin system